MGVIRGTTASNAGVTTRCERVRLSRAAIAPSSGFPVTRKTWRLPLRWSRRVSTSNLLWRVRVEDGERLPCRGPAILAANHVSFFDSVVLIMAVRRTLSFVGKVEYLDSWKTRRLLPAFGMIPVDRGDGRRAVAALKIAARMLWAGRMFAIYPEGTRSADGDLHAGHTGAAYLSMATGVPIVPTGIVGTTASSRRARGSRARSDRSRFGSATRSTQRTTPAAAATVDG